MNFNEKEVVEFYNMLGHIEETEIRMIDPKNGIPESIFVNSSEEFLSVCKQYNGKKLLYAGINERIPGKKDGVSVLTVKGLFLDIDAVRAEGFKKQPATEQELEIATEIKDKIVADCLKAGIKQPAIINSGNGFQLFFRLPQINIDNDNRDKIQEQLQLFQQSMINDYDVNGAIDKIGDLPRIIKITGTFNIKGDNTDDRPHRVAKFLNNPMEVREDKKLLDIINKLTKEDMKPRETYSITETDNFDTNKLPKCISYLYNDYVFKEEFGWMRTVEILASFFRGIGLSEEHSCKLIEDWAIKQEYHEEDEDNDIFSIVSRIYRNKIFVANCEKIRMGSGGYPEMGLKELFHNVDLDECCGHYKNPVVYYNAKNNNETIPEDFLYVKNIKQDGTEEKAVDIDKISEHIENKFNIRTIYGIREETIEVYNEGIWTTKGKGIIKSEIEKRLKKWSRNLTVSEVLEKIKRRTETDREDADKVPDYKRCVGNGVLDVEDHNNIKLIPHSREYNFRSKYPMDYDINAKCPIFIKFVNETFYEEDVNMFQEWLGFHLPRKYSFKKATIFHGEKNTGKSVILNLLTLFVGGNVSGLSLQEISNGKPFDLMALKDKDANIHDDLSSSDMKCVGGFKKAVGDGFIDGEQKFGDKSRFRNTAKDTNACNKIPSPGEDVDDEAYYERILLFPIDNVIEKKDMDRDLLDKMTTPEELSGILNWAIEGYKRLVKQNYFSNEKTPEETKFIMVKNGEPLGEFASDILKEEHGNKITKDEMYQIYCKWCMDHKPKLSPDSKDKVGKNLTKFAPFCSAQSNGAKRYWLNVNTTDSYYTFLKSIRVYLKENSKDDSNHINKDIVEGVIAVKDKDFSKLEEKYRQEGLL